jgi:diketogulonate reductase-like aldo/keto reductase
LDDSDFLMLVCSGHSKHDDVKGGFEASLKALGTDYIDLYLMHWPPTSVGGTSMPPFRLKFWSDVSLTYRQDLGAHWEPDHCGRLEGDGKAP